MAGSIVRVLYSGQAAARVRIDDGGERVMPDQQTCIRYRFGHDGSLTRPPLCQYLVTAPPGTHQVYITTIPECRFGTPGEFTCIDPRDFFFDAIEAMGPIALKVVVHSPVNILITDPDGRRIGYDADSGSVVNEIPGMRSWPNGTHRPSWNARRQVALATGRTTAGGT